MKKYKSYKYRIYPNDIQKELIEKTFGCSRFIWNKMLEDRKNQIFYNGKLSKITPAKYKEEYTWLREVDSMALCNAQKQFDIAFSRFCREKNIGFPKSRKKKGLQSYTTNYHKDRNNIRFIEGKFLHLPKLGNVKIKMHREISDDCNIKEAVIKRNPSNNYYVCIVVEYETKSNNNELDINNSIGLDYSSSFLYVDSNGVVANMPHFYRKSEKRLAIAQRKLSHMVIGSNNYQKQLLIVNRIYEKIRNQRNDYLHKITTNLSNNYDYIFIEDINLTNIAKSLKSLGKSTMDNGFGLFRKFLSYKMENKCKYLVKIDKMFPSSKKCHVCGYKKIDMTLNDRKWKCPICESLLDRDVNAAINIRNEGIRLVKNNLGVQGDSLCNLNLYRFLNKKTFCYTTTLDCD